MSAECFIEKRSSGETSKPIRVVAIGGLVAGFGVPGEHVLQENNELSALVAVFVPVLLGQLMGQEISSLSLVQLEAALRDAKHGLGV